MATFIIAAIVGVGIGVLSGLLGIGGGTVMVPIFRLGFGMAAIQATATSLFAIIPTSLAGCITHIRNRTCVVPMGIAAGVGGACMSPLGVYLASISPSWAIMLAAACVIGYSAVTMLRKGLATPHAAGGRQAASSASSRHESLAKPQVSTASNVDAPAELAERPSKRQLAIGAAAGLIAGVLSGYVGVGGGFIMVPLFVAFAAMPMKKASGTSLIAVTILAIPGTVEQIMLGNVMVTAGLALAVGSIPGAFFGANLIKRVSERTLRLAFGGMLLCVAVVLAVNEFLVPSL
jgi:uncharacterized membrane protein YfcA